MTVDTESRLRELARELIDTCLGIHDAAIFADVVRLLHSHFAPSPCAFDIVKAAVEEATGPLAPETPEGVLVQEALCAATERAVAEVVELLVYVINGLTPYGDAFRDQALAVKQRAEAIRSLSPIPHYAERVALQARIVEAKKWLPRFCDCDEIKGTCDACKYVPGLERQLAEKGGPL